jgi:hypothetical protein
MPRLLAAMLGVLATAISVEAASVADLPAAARAGLAPAVDAVMGRFNVDEDRRRETPEIQAVGPADEPSMLRATYRKAGGQHDVLAVELGAAPAVTVRFRVSELEKRVTNINGGDLHAALAKAPWKPTPRGYLIDVRLRWNGEAWEPAGAPVEHPTLGVVGRPALDEVLERGTLDAGPATR